MKRETSDFQPPEDLNEILIKDNISQKNNQDETNELMFTVSDPARIS